MIHRLRSIGIRIFRVLTMRSSHKPGSGFQETSSFNRLLTQTQFGHGIVPILTRLASSQHP
jgi:hypothetical protein